MDLPSLRARAVAALGSHADPLAALALARGDLDIEQDVARWESSHGTVRAHVVVMRLPASLVASIDVHPAVRDALVAAFARASSEEPGHSLADLRIEVVADEHGARRGPYR